MLNETGCPNLHGCDFLWELLNELLMSLSLRGDNVMMRFKNSTDAQKT